MSELRILPAYISRRPFTALPQYPFKDKIKDSVKKIKYIFLETYGQVSDYAGNAVSSLPVKNKLSFKNMKRYFKKSYLLPGFIIAVFAVIVIALIGFGLGGTPATTVLSSEDQRVEIRKPKARQAINKMFLFPLKDAKGQEVSKLRFFVETAELRDEIIVKGKRATSVKGRTFLIVNLKITNNFDKAVSINTRDYFRLSVNNSSEKLAPDIHNDPVEVQPISTKYTRVGLPINDTDKNLILQVGEVSGKKENINLNNLK